MDWLDLLAVQGTLKSLLQHHSTKASVLWCSAFFMVQLSHLYMTTGKTIALTRWTFLRKVMSLLFNMLSRLVIAFLPRSKWCFILVIFAQLLNDMISVASMFQMRVMRLREVRSFTYGWSIRKGQSLKACPDCQSPVPMDLTSMEQANCRCEVKHG